MFGDGESTTAPPRERRFLAWSCTVTQFGGSCGPLPSLSSTFIQHLDDEMKQPVHCSHAACYYKNIYQMYVTNARSSVLVNRKPCHRNNETIGPTIGPTAQSGV